MNRADEIERLRDEVEQAREALFAHQDKQPLDRHSEEWVRWQRHDEGLQHILIDAVLALPKEPTRGGAWWTYDPLGDGIEEDKP